MCARIILLSLFAHASRLTFASYVLRVFPPRAFEESGDMYPRMPCLTTYTHTGDEHNEKTRGINKNKSGVVPLLLYSEMYA